MNELRTPYHPLPRSVKRNIIFEIKFKILRFDLPVHICYLTPLISDTFKIDSKTIIDVTFNY